MKKRIYYHDTDCGGVVYYANYLKYFEEARTEYLEERGIVMTELAKKEVFFVVARQEVDYKLPVRYADSLDISAKVSLVRSARLEFDQQVYNQSGQLTTQAKTTMVCVDGNLKPIPIPEDVKAKLN